MRLLQLCILFLIPTYCWAILDLHVQEPLHVFEKPKPKAKEISELAKGDVVVISPDLYGNYRKVLVMYQGKRTAGYIPNKQIKESYIRDRDEELNANEVAPLVKRHMSFGIFGGVSYLKQQGSQSFADEFGNTYNVSSLQSTSPVFAFYADVPINERWVVRPYLSFRSSKFTGPATASQNIGAIGSPSVEVDETMVGVGGLLKYYPWATGPFWFGGAIEIAHAITASATITEQITISSPNISKPNYVFGDGALGWDIGFGDFVLSPELRLGAAAGAGPVLIDAEFLLGFSIVL